jgi:hypothetical protein
VTERFAGGVKHQRVWLGGLVLGWLALAGSYHVALPFFGVLSIVTWALIALCWLWVIGLPVALVVSLTWRRVLRLVLAWGMGGVLAGAVLWTLGLPPCTPEDLVAGHRDDLARLAAAYRTGQIKGDRTLPLRLRFLSVDGQIHVRCGSSGPEPESADCALFLLTLQNWRHEAGGGLAYYATAPGSGALLATAEGGTGWPVRELGAGWWAVD